MIRKHRDLVAALAVGAGAAFAVATVGAQERPSPFDLSIEQLGELQVTSVSRRGETLSEAAASIYVITAEDIRRSGVTTIPDALRLAPGVEVARSSANQWAISIRGFSTTLSNKLLVLVDGRSVYSPLYAGVYWDVQDTLLADIERIEVVSGPGGASWGANAVNGVINIITYTAAETQGGLLELGAGNEEEVAAGFRYGWKLSDKMEARAYVKHFERDASQLAGGGAAVDDWRKSQTGFALTWRPSEADAINVRADAYDGEESVIVMGNLSLNTPPPPDYPGKVDVSGHNVLARWRHELADDSNWRMQFFYDSTDRQSPGTFNETRDTFDFDFQRDLANRGRHDILLGASLRSTSDDVDNSQLVRFEPRSRSDQTFSTFIQDRIDLHEKLSLTLGTKLEDNDYSGFEYQPSVRLSWLASEQHTIWAAVSRAVRIPARLDTDLRLTAPFRVVGAPYPYFVTINGTPGFDSEELLAYEAGYRIEIRDNLSLDLAVFDNYYDDLQTAEMLPQVFVPGPPPYVRLFASLANLMEGESYGGTVVLNWEPITSWRLQFQYAHLELDLTNKPGSTDAASRNVRGNSPKSQLQVLSFLELPHELSLYTSVRYVETLPNQGVPSYTAFDWSLAWQPREGLRASLNIQNANAAEHLEFGGGSQVERSSFLKVVWSF